MKAVRVNFLLAFFAVATAIILLPKPAHADPHAVFYTATGQRQLFFNLLASLNQADYVEPAEGENSRESLAKLYNSELNAESLGLASGDDPSLTLDALLSSTQTDLSAVVTRPITLDGEDQFASYLAYQQALEVARRAALKQWSEMALCEVLGRPNCDLDKDELSEKSYGFDTEPIGTANKSFENGSWIALLAGTKLGDDKAKEIAKNYNENKGFEPGTATSNEFSQLRQNNKDNAEALEEINQDALRSLAASLPLTKNPYENIGLVKEDGKTKIALDTTDEVYDDLFNQAFANKLYSQLATDETNQIAAETVKLNQKATQNEDGTRAATRLVSKLVPYKDDEELCGGENLGAFGAAATAFNIPSLCLLDNLFNIIENSTTELVVIPEVHTDARQALLNSATAAQIQAPVYAPLEIQEQPIHPGQKPLIREDIQFVEDVDGLGDVPGAVPVGAAEAAIVAGIADGEGEVAAAVDNIIQKGNLNLPAAIDASAYGPTFLELKTTDALFPGAITNELCQCGLESILNDFGSEVMGLVREL